MKCLSQVQAAILLTLLTILSSAFILPYMESLKQETLFQSKLMSRCKCKPELSLVMVYGNYIYLYNYGDDELKLEKVYIDNKEYSEFTVYVYDGSKWVNVEHNIPPGSLVKIQLSMSVEGEEVVLLTDRGVWCAMED